MGGRPWLWRVGPKQGRSLFGGWGLCLGPPRSGKVPGVCATLAWEGPYCLPLLISPASLLCPRTNLARGKGGALEGRELTWEFSRLPVPEWVGQSPSSSLRLLPEDRQILNHCATRETQNNGF